MQIQDVLVIGSGKRVRETALPAFHRMAESFRVRRILARTAKTIEAEGERHDVGAFSEVRPDDLSGIGLVYLAVAKNAVPTVLAALVRQDPGRFELLIDTPVVRFRNFRHASQLARFRRASVAEDCTALPWLDTVRAFVAEGTIGSLRRVLFQHSAYAYHATATAKALFGVTQIMRAARRRLGADSAVREITMAGGSEVELREPRDYATGRLVLMGERGWITDSPEETEQGSVLEPFDEAGACRGFRIGGTRTVLDGAETDLMRGPPSDARVTARMEAMKRVGFLRLLRRLARGESAYSVESALEDMVVDYWLEKLGRYRATPFTRPDAPFGRAFLRLLTR
jgi:hypothetical protein